MQLELMQKDSSSEHKSKLEARNIKKEDIKAYNLRRIIRFNARLSVLN